MNWKLREFGPDGDYDLMTEVHNRVYADYPTLADDFRRQDRLKEEKILRRRWIAEEDGRVVGLGYLGNNSWAYHPRKFSTEVWVVPEARGRGLGAAIYDLVMETAATFDPIVVRGMIREDWEADVRWAKSRGYREAQREQESRLDITAFDPEAFAGDIRRAVDQGIRIATWAELKDDPEAARAYYDMSNMVGRDVPYPDPQTDIPFELWCERMFTSPRMIPECNVIALDGDRFIGMSNMWREEAEGRVETGLTGVLRDYRKRGIASAVKVRCIAEAKKLGYTHTLTWNEENNRGMLGINIRLGFEMKPAWIEFEKVFDANAYEESKKEQQVKS